MKKTLIFIAVVLLVSMIGVFTLSSCNLQKILENADTTEDASSTDKDGSVALIESFFEKTLTDPDVVVTCTNATGEVQFTETIKGTDSVTVGKDGSETYAFIKDGFYYWVSISQEADEDGEITERHFYSCSDETKSSYLADMESIYKVNHGQFMSNINLVSMLTEEEGSTFNCSIHAEKTDGVTTATLDFAFTTANGTYSITASSEEDLVKTVHIVVNDLTSSQGNRDLTMTFVYGSASVTLPDIDIWEREEAARAAKIEANEQAIDSRDEFFSSALRADSVKVTVTDYLTFTPLLTETIANGIDCVDYGTAKTYTYPVEVDEENVDFYFVIDGDEKIYTKNGDDYGDNCLVWYSSYISQMDDLKETAEFTYELRDDGNMSFNVKVEDEVVYSISAQQGETIAQIGISGIDDEGTRFLTGVTLEYGKAELQKPDLSGFTLIE